MAAPCRRRRYGPTASCWHPPGSGRIRWSAWPAAGSTPGPDWTAAQRSRCCREGFLEDALFGCGAEEVEHEAADEFRVVGDGDVTESVEPAELRVGDKRQEAGGLHADQG